MNQKPTAQLVGFYGAGAIFEDRRTYTAEDEDWRPRQTSKGASLVIIPKR